MYANYQKINKYILILLILSLSVGLIFPLVVDYQLYIIGGLCLFLLMFFPKYLVILFVNFSIWDETISISPSVSITKVLGVVLLVRWAIDIYRSKSIQLKKSLPIFGVLLFIIYGMLSYSWSYSPVDTLNRSITMIQIGLMTLILPYYLSNYALLKKILISISFSSLMMALLIILNYFSGNVVLDEQGLFRSSINTAFDPNIAAMSIGLGYSFALAWLLWGPKSKLKIIKILFTTIILIGGLLTLSRGFIVVAVLTSIVAFYLYFKQTNFRIQSFGVIVVLVVLLFIILISTGLLEALTLRLETILHPVIANPRISIWYVAINTFKTSPIFGIGLGAFSSSYSLFESYLPNLTRVFYVDRDVHNFYLQVLVELGIIGLSIIFMIILSVLSKLTRINSNTPWSQYAILFGLILIFSGAFFLPLLFRKITWLPIVLSISYFQYIRKFDPQIARNKWLRFQNSKKT